MLIRIIRSNDKTLLDTFRELSSHFEQSSLTIFHIGGSTSNGLDLEYEIDSPNVCIINNIKLLTSDNSKTICMARGVFDANLFPNHNQDRNPNPSTFINFRSPSATFDEIQLSDNFSLDEIRVIDKLLNPLKINGVIDESQSSLNAIVSAQIEQLRQLSLEFARSQFNAQAHLDQEYRIRENSLLDRINREEERLKAVSDNEQIHLEGERAKIEQWRNEINDREPQHERRRLRESLTKDLKSSLDSPTSKVKLEEYAANGLYIAFSIFLIAISIRLTFDIGSPLTLAFWALTIKSAAIALADGAFAWAGLRGIRSAAVTSRQYDQAVRQYAFDMDRASWIVETLVQMNSMEKSTIPDQILSAFCSNIFSSKSDNKDDGRSLESFAALFDVTSKAKIGTNGVEFEIDRKGAKKLAADT